MRGRLLGVLRSSSSGRTRRMPPPPEQQRPARAPSSSLHHRHHHRYRGYASTSAKSTASSSTSSTASTSLVRNLVNQYTAVLDRYPLTTKMITSGCIAASGDLLCQFCFPASTPAEDNNDKSTTTTTATGIDDEAAVKSELSGRSAPQDNKDEQHSESSSLPSTIAASSWTALSSWDVERTGRFGVLGAVLVAPTVHHWYNFLHRFTAAATSTASAGGLRLLGVRVAADQVLFAPVFTTAWLLSLRTLERPHEHGVVDWQSMLRNEVPSVVVANWVLWIPAQVVNFALVPLKFQVLFSNIIALAWNVYLSYQTSSTSRVVTNYSERR